MPEWPYHPLPDPEDSGLPKAFPQPASPLTRKYPPGTRMANIMIPVEIPGKTILIHMVLPEADARAIVNMTDKDAIKLGGVFVTIKAFLTKLVEEEG